MPNRAFRRIDEKDSTLFLWDIVVEFDLAIPARGLVDGEVVRPLEILIGDGNEAASAERLFTFRRTLEPSWKTARCAPASTHASSGTSKVMPLPAAFLTRKSRPMRLLTTSSVASITQIAWTLF